MHPDLDGDDNQLPSRARVFYYQVEPECSCVNCFGTCPLITANAHPSSTKNKAKADTLARPRQYQEWTLFAAPLKHSSPESALIVRTYSAAAVAVSQCGLS